MFAYFILYCIHSMQYVLCLSYQFKTQESAQSWEKKTYFSKLGSTQLKSSDLPKCRKQYRKKKLHYAIRTKYMHEHPKMQRTTTAEVGHLAKSSIIKLKQVTTSVSTRSTDCILPKLLSKH